MGSGASRSVITKKTDELIAQTFIQSTTNYQTEIEVGQNLQVNCSATAIGGGRPEDSDACVSCYTAIGEQQAARYNSLRARGRVPTESYETEMRGYAAQMEACKVKCKACVVSDVSQTQSFSWRVGAFNKSVVKNTFDATIKTNLDQALTDNQDVLSSVAGALGPADRQKVSTFIANRIAQMVTEDVLENIYTRVSSVQNVTISGSTVARGITQNSAVSGVTDVISKRNISNTLLSETEWSNQQTLYNDENTIGAVGGALRKAALSFGELFDSIIGKIMVITVAAVLIAATALAIYAIIKDVNRV